MESRLKYLAAEKLTQKSIDKFDKKETDRIKFIL